MIRNLNKHTSSSGRYYWTFEVCVSPVQTDLSWYETGWRYYPDSGHILNPKHYSRRDEQWHDSMLLISPQAFQYLKRLVREEIGAQGEKQTEPIDELVEMYETDEPTFRANYPKRYREVFIEAGKRKSNNPEGYELLFEIPNLPPGRLWPDVVLEAVSKRIMHRQFPVVEFREAVDAEIFSSADAEFVKQQLEAAVTA